MTSTIKVNKIEKVDGSTIELGGPGTAVNLACGATQTGFGRTGTVDWCTTAKTSPFTAVSGDGYFVNTSGGVVTVTLPASPSAGDIVSIKDYAGTAATNNITIGRNGSKIAGGCGTCGTIETNNAFVTLIYVDATKGWLPTDDSNSEISGAQSFMTATGGCVTTSGDYKIHTFNADANFVVSQAGTGPALFTDVSYMVVAGGGGGGWCTGGGGGAGGFREAKVTGDPYTASPLASSTGITVPAATYPITVGGGGAGRATPGAKGTNGVASVFSTITSAGGGGGGSRSTGVYPGSAGGSGGGAGGNQGPGSQGAGNTPPVSPPQGNDGGSSDPGPQNQAGGGGGATAVGQSFPQSPYKSAGGAGATTSINGTPTARAGGGGSGGGYPNNGGGAGGAGGGGTGAGPTGGQTAGSTNTGGGGGGGSHPAYPTVGGSAGGSGIVIIRYKFQ